MPPSSDRPEDPSVFTAGGTQITCDGEWAPPSREGLFFEGSEGGEVGAERVRRCLPRERLNRDDVPAQLRHTDRALGPQTPIGYHRQRGNGSSRSGSTGDGGSAEAGDSGSSDRSAGEPGAGAAKETKPTSPDGGKPSKS